MMIYSKFTSESYETLSAINAAKSHQLEAESVRLGLPPEPVDPDAAPRAEIAEIGRMGATGALVADGLWQVSGFPVVPIDRDLLVPSAETLTGFRQIADHWRHNRVDGVGIPAGTHPSGRTVVALRGTPAALKTWLSEHAVEHVRKTDEDRVIWEGRTYRDVPPYVTVRWAPPGGRPGIKVVTQGLAALHRATDELLHGKTREAEQRMAWLAWSVGCVWNVPPIVDTQLPVATARQRLEVKSRKLGAGVEVVGEGEFVPMHVLQPDGWRLDGSPLPETDGFPAWLVDALGARWVDEVLVDGTWRASRRRVA